MALSCAGFYFRDGSPRRAKVSVGERGTSDLTRLAESKDSRCDEAYYQLHHLLYRRNAVMIIRYFDPHRPLHCNGDWASATGCNFSHFKFRRNIARLHASAKDYERGEGWGLDESQRRKGEKSRNICWLVDLNLFSEEWGVERAYLHSFAIRPCCTTELGSWWDY